MDPRKQQLEQALAEAKALQERSDLDDAGRADLKARVERIVELRDEIKLDEDIRAQLGGYPAGGESTTSGEFKQTLAQVHGLKFAEHDLQGLQRAALAKARFQIGAKAVQAESDFAGSAANVLDLGQIDPAVRTRFRLASLIPAKFIGNAGAEAGNDVTYYKPSVLATGGTAVSEAGALPQSSPTWVAVNEPIRKVGHYAHVPDEAIQDWAAFTGVLGNEMLDGLIAVENTQLLVGSGVAPNLAGIFDDSRSVTALSQGTDTVIDAIMKALDKVRGLGFVEPDAIVMRSADWTPIRLSKSADDEYYFNPLGVSGASARAIDGVPVYLCEEGTAGHVYVGQFASLRAYIRKPASLEVTNSDQDDFIKDLSKVRVIERFALAVPSSVKFCDLTLS